MQTGAAFRAALEALGELLVEYGRVRQPVPGWQLGKYEADRAALALTELAATQGASVQALGEARPGLLPGAYACARCGLEAGATAAWLAGPDDPFEREGRWLGYARDDVLLRTDLAREVAERSIGAGEELGRGAAELREWLAAIQAKLPRGQVVRRPKFRALLKTLGHGELYMGYRLACQMVHGTASSLHAVHRFDGIVEGYIPPDEPMPPSIYGQLATPKEWCLPLRMVAWGVMIAAPVILQRLGVPFLALDPLDLRQEQLHRAVDDLEASVED